MTAFMASVQNKTATIGGTLTVYWICRALTAVFIYHINDFRLCRLEAKPHFDHYLMLKAGTLWRPVAKSVLVDLLTLSDDGVYSI